MGVLSENAIIGASAAGGYDIDYSCRFNDGDNSYLARTPSSVGNQKTWTVSFWYKRTDMGNYESGDPYIIVGGSGTNPITIIGIDRNDYLWLRNVTSSGYDINLLTSQVFRDPSAWYHFVVAMDTTQGTAANRTKIYVNGSQVTAFGTETYPAQNLVTGINDNTLQEIMKGDNYHSGYLADFNLIDGLALTPSSFGETDVLTNEWKAIKYAGSYGTNGFFLEFKEGGMITYDREAEIAVTSSFTWAFSSSGNTSGEDLVNGLLTNDDAGGGWMPSGSNTDRWVKFDFGSGKVYKNAQWYWINASGTEGTWKWQGSNDDSSWTDIGSSFNLTTYGGGVDNTLRNQTFSSELGSNTTSYRYYRILGLTGSANTSGRRLAMYFSESVPGLGNDNSGNGNNYTPTNLVASDQMIDTPQNSTGGNFCTFNPLSLVGAGWTPTFAEGNLYARMYSDYDARGSMAMESGKWYWEVLVGEAGTNYMMLGIGDPTSTASMYNSATNGVAYYGNNGNIYKQAAGASYGAAYTIGDIMGVAFNMDDREITFYKNNVSQGVVTGVPSTPSIYVAAVSSASWAAGWINFGQDSSFAGNETAQGNTDTNDCGDFYYAPPAGYLALCTNNLADPSIALPGENFNSILWTGDGTSPRSFTGVGFTPDFTWTKNRTTGVSHMLYDTVRGAGNDKELSSDSVAIEGGGNSDTYGYLSAFGSDGFTTTDGSGSPNYYFNENTKNFVSWNWKAGGTPTATNSAGAGNVPTAGSVKINGVNSGSALAGSTPVLKLAANTTSGFSIGTYLGDGANATLAHGLSQGPELVIVKAIVGATYNWTAGWTPSAAWTDYMHLDTTAAAVDDAAFWQDTAPTASVINIGANGNVSATGDTFVFYAWHSVEGYSKIGTYASNNSTDGPFVYLGFTPAFIMLKCTNATDNWNLYDIKRNGYNGTGGTYQLRADTTAAGFTAAGTMVDLVSNGMKIRTNDPGTNGSSRNYIYLAFAESPFKTSRAR